MKSTLFKSTILWLWCLSSVEAGTQVIMKVSDGSQNYLSVQGDKLRIDTKSDASVVFDLKTQEFMTINHAAKQFQRFDKSTATGVRKQIDDAKRQMEAQMANMPPEQRQMMQQMMSRMGDSQMGLSQPRKKNYRYVQSNRSDKAAGYTCKIMERWLDAKKDKEYCLTPIEQIKGASEVYNAWKQVNQLFSSIWKNAQTHDLERLNAFPLITTDFEAGKPERTELQSIKTKIFDKDFFTAPSNYREQKLK